jgi:nitronate monooxygenase
LNSFRQGNRPLLTSSSIAPLLIGNLTANIPIIQGGMGVGVSLSGLASAVANESCIGVIASAGIGMKEPDFFSNYLEANTRALRREIRSAKARTKGIVGLNIMVALSNFDLLAETAIEEKIDIIFAGAGLPLSLPQHLKADSKTLLVPIVSSARAVGLICKRWLHHFDYLPDAIVVEGPLAGGHLGFKVEHISDPDFDLDKLLLKVLEEVTQYSQRYGKQIPVIVGGGVYSGGDILKFIRLGASGVQMGTRFVATHECDADSSFKQAYLDASPEGLIIIKSPVGMPARAIRNRYLDDVESGMKKPFKCPYHCIITCDYKNSPYCIAHALISAQQGFMHNGFAFAGANAHRVHEIVSVKQLVASLVDEYTAAAKSSPS